MTTFIVYIAPLIALVAFAAFVIRMLTRSCFRDYEKFHEPDYHK